MFLMSLTTSPPIVSLIAAASKSCGWLRLTRPSGSRSDVDAWTFDDSGFLSFFFFFLHFVTATQLCCICYFLSPTSCLPASWAPAQSATLACHPGCTNSFTPIFYSAFHSNLLLLLRLHYHINYRLSHTRWFPLVSHLHQVDNASTSLNYSADNLNQRESIHILKRTPTFSGGGASTRGSLHPLDVCVCLPPVRKISQQIFTNIWRLY